MHMSIFVMVYININVLGVGCAAVKKKQDLQAHIYVWKEIHM